MGWISFESAPRMMPAERFCEAAWTHRFTWTVIIASPKIMQTHGMSTTTATSCGSTAESSATGGSIADVSSLRPAGCLQKMPRCYNMQQPAGLARGAACTSRGSKNRRRGFSLIQALGAPSLGCAACANVRELLLVEEEGRQRAGRRPRKPITATVLFVWVCQNRRIVDQTVWTPGLVYSFLVLS